MPVAGSMPESVQRQRKQEGRNKEGKNRSRMRTF